MNNPQQPIQLTAHKEFWLQVISLLNELPINKAFNVSYNLEQAVKSAEESSKPSEEVELTSEDKVVENTELENESFE